MADGTAKNIEDITEGDRVASTDPDTGQDTTSRVERTFTHDKVATLRVTTTTGELVTTSNHPLYVEDKGFTPAGRLHQGDRLRGPDGTTTEVTTLQPTGTTETVHNLGVAGTHNYYVRTGTHWTLAHNTGPIPTETCVKVTQKVQELAQTEADKEMQALRGMFSRKQLDAADQGPWLDRPFAGTAIHNKVRVQIEEMFPGVTYNPNSWPDFMIPKELSGADAECATYVIP